MSHNWKMVAPPSKPKAVSLHILSTLHPTISWPLVPERILYPLEMYPIQVGYLTAFILLTESEFDSYDILVDLGKTWCLCVHVLGPSIFYTYHVSHYTDSDVTSTFENWYPIAAKRQIIVGKRAVMRGHRTWEEECWIRNRKTRFQSCSATDINANPADHPVTVNICLTNEWMLYDLECITWTHIVNEGAD